MFSGGKKSFSFLEGVNPDTVSRIQIEKGVFDVVYSQSSGLIYVTYFDSFSGFKWNENNKTFIKQFETSIKDTTELSILSITLAPKNSSGGDQIYISVGSFNPMKNVYRLGGRELKKRVRLLDTRYIDDESIWWILASNTDRHILLIHPYRTPFIYILVREQKHGKVDLNLVNIPDRRCLRRIELIGQLLILGDEGNDKLHMCELIVTESDAFIKPGSERGPIESSRGSFAALSNVVGDQYEHVHLFSVRYKSPDCAEISEYKFSTSVSGSELNQLPKQPIHTLRVEGEFRLHCLVNLNYYSSVLIGETDDYELCAVELLKQQVNHHVQQSNS